MEIVLKIIGSDNKGIKKPGGEILFGLEKQKGFLKKEYKKALQHLTASEIKSRVGSDTFTNYFKFAFVRNPMIARKFNGSAFNRIVIFLTSETFFSSRNCRFFSISISEDLKRYLCR
ncbi:MAG: hypothetical protein CBC35_06285 [Planctomycetes bacterium TMED75]|nr:MAG: hypothetical protein CBC35_06285 [Planctomycetes bacterium TMED75]|tara:strand:- start:314 stop:664 length:351 start_codon:yes stop_codon:yes gene_type:complete